MIILPQFAPPDNLGPRMLKPDYLGTDTVKHIFCPVTPIFFTLLHAFYSFIHPYAAFYTSHMTYLGGHLHLYVRRSTEVGGNRDCH